MNITSNCLTSVLVVVLCILAPDVARCQNNEPEDVGMRISAGIGSSRADTGIVTQAGGGLAARLSAAVRYKRIVITFRRTWNTGGSSRHDALVFGKLHDEYYEDGYLLGYALFMERRLRIIISAGVSKITGREVIDGPMTWFGTGSMVDIDPHPGIPFEIGFYGGSSVLAINFILYGNMNQAHSFMGITVGLTLGT